MKSVTVLLSSFNGERYIKEQIDSVLAQEGVELHFLVRDDGSTDSTQRILDRYMNEGKLVWYTGDNLRPANSFLNLLQNAPVSDYYAFCDQDDYWYPNKLSAAIKIIEEQDGPSLYCSDTYIADASLNILDKSHKECSFIFGESLITNPVTGCTAVFNKALRDVVVSYLPSVANMHDWWIYQICLAIGGYFYLDHNSFILYRQHGGNVIGGLHDASITRRRHLLLMLGYHSGNVRHTIACQLYEGFRHLMPEDNVSFLHMAVHYRDSWINTLKFAWIGGRKVLNKRVKLSFVLAVLRRLF